MAHSKHTVQQYLSQAALAGAVLTIVAAAQTTLAADIYRYVDNTGRTVYSSTLPAEYVRNGYTVLNERGQVVREVPRAPSAEELAAQQALAEQNKAASAAKKAQEEADKLLVRLYRTPDDIERKREVSAQQADTQIALVRNSITKLEEDRKRLEGAVENAKKNSREPAPETIKEIEGVNAEMDKLQAQIAKLEADKLEALAALDRDAKRLRELQGLPPAPETPATTTAPAAPSAEQPAAQ